MKLRLRNPLSITRFVFTFLILFGWNIGSFANDSTKETVATINFYYDVREYPTINILTSTKGLPLGFSIWGFTDLHGNQNDPQNSKDLARYFMEYRLSRQLNSKWTAGISGLGIQIEYNDFNSASNNVFRFGVTFKHKLPFPKQNGWLQWRFFPIETDGSGQQASIIYFIPIYDNFFITGFADLNMSAKGPDRWVVEPQLNFKLNDRFSALLEFRYNAYEAINSNLKGKGAALGFGIKF